MSHILHNLKFRMYLISLYRSLLLFIAQPEQSAHMIVCYEKEVVMVWTNTSWEHRWVGRSSSWVGHGWHCRGRVAWQHICVIAQSCKAPIYYVSQRYIMIRWGLTLLDDMGGKLQRALWYHAMCKPSVYDAWCCQILLNECLLKKMLLPVPDMDATDGIVIHAGS